MRLIRLASNATYKERTSWLCLKPCFRRLHNLSISIASLCDAEQICGDDLIKPISKSPPKGGELRMDSIDSQTIEGPQTYKMEFLRPQESHQCRHSAWIRQGNATESTTFESRGRDGRRNMCPLACCMHVHSLRHEREKKRKERTRWWIHRTKILQETASHVELPVSQSSRGAPRNSRTDPYHQGSLSKEN